MKVLVVAGSSGGHIFPALALLERLKEKGIDTLLILPKKNITDRIRCFNQSPTTIDILPITSSLDFRNLSAILKFILGSLKSLAVLLKFYPRIVVGFGSINSIPFILLGKLLRRKTLIHEQNVIPGRANRLLSNFADRIAVSFMETRKYLKRHEDKVVFTGNPLRKEMMRIEKNQARIFFGFSNNKSTILVIGGSQGSHSINLGFMEALSKLSFRNQLQVIHLCGSQDQEFLKEKYRTLGVDVRLYAFFDSMQYAFSASDLVVSRAGATTVSEIIRYKIPAIIIPYPFAYQHQLANASLLKKSGVAVIINDDELHTDILERTMENFFRSPENLVAISRYYEKLETPNADELLAEVIISLS